MVQSVWGTVRSLFHNPSCCWMARSTGPEQMMDVQLTCTITLAGGQARGPIRTTAIWRVLFGHVKEIFPLGPSGVYGFSHGLPTLRSSIPLSSLRFLTCSLPPHHTCYTSVRQISMYSQIWRCADWNRPDRFLSSPFRFWYRLGRMACVLGRGTLVQYS